jgi:glycosyltransferase involved in cell wall biosynthesis
LRLAIVVPGGVDRSGEVRVIPAFVALIERLARRHDLEVFALRQEQRPGTWSLAGATVHNAGSSRAIWRTLNPLGAAHRRAPFDVVQSLFSGAAGFVACIAAGQVRVPFAVHVAGGELQSIPQIEYGGSRRWLGRWRETQVLRRAAAVSAASEPMLRSLRALGVEPRRIPLGVDLARWPPRAPVERQAQRPGRLIHAASLNRVKDQATLLRALALLLRSGQEFHIDIAGEDTLGGQVQGLSAELGLGERVRFHGFMRQAELHALTARADICVMSSLHEAGPLAMLEAAALGVPTVGTRVGHIEEWAPDAALAVPPGDPPALAAALASLLSDEPRRLRLAMAAHARAVAEDADYTARAFESLYESLRGARLRA